VKYALLMYADPDHTRGMSQAEIDEVMVKHRTLREELAAADELTGGAGLAFPEETTLLRLDGTRTQGPFATNAAEHLTAYYYFDVADDDRATEIAQRVLDHHVVAVEVRHIHDST
jgi:hypothetical protein